MTAICAAILLNESFTSVQILGGILTLAGIIIVHRSRDQV
jgi:drug/metabolite transporter (DMT)-like permease